MADDLSPTTALRGDFLRRLYVVSGGRTTGGVPMGDIGRDLGLGEAETEGVVEWLCDRALAAWFAFGGMIRITPAGVDAAEAGSRESLGVAPRRAAEKGASAARLDSIASSAADDFAYDLFVSHAAEDKDVFVRPLVRELEHRGLRVWFDEAELEVGDSLIERIEDGLRRSRFGVVVLSRAFFGKNWPRAELNALASRELSTGDPVVLPVWLDVDASAVREHSPLLADRFALRAGDGLSSIADKLQVRIRRDRPQMSPTTAQMTQLKTPDESRELDSVRLRGSIYPYSWSPVVRSDERALVSRVAVAARAPAAPEPMFRSSEQKDFEDAVKSSQLESLMIDLTTHTGRATGEHSRRRVDPTGSWIVTLERPPARLALWPKWSANAQAVISLRPGIGIGPAGWLIACLDVIVRATDDGAAEEERGTPLSLDDLYSLLYVPLEALLDDIAPRVLPPVTRQQKQEILAVGCLLIPSGGGLNNYARLDLYARDRALGATDASGIEWYASSLDEVETPAARTDTIRRRIETLFVDGGYSEYEAAIERLTPPPLAPPPPM